MNLELLQKLDIDSSMGLKDVLEELEAKQFEILERLEAVSDEKRRAELDELNQQVEVEILRVKDEIKVLSSALFIDDEEEKETVSAKDLKRASVESKMNALKQKEAERIAKEGRSVKVDNEEFIDITPVTDSPEAKTPNELELALRDYRNQNYSAAFPVLKKYAESGDAAIQYILSQMYSDGNGAKQDAERAEYWLKNSADNGDFTAQFSYGMQLLAANNDNDEKSKEGLHYLELAADKNHKNAKIQYIESINKGYGTAADAQRAVSYCNELIEKAEDSFETKKYDDYMNELKKSIKVVKTKERKVVLSTVFTIFGALLLVLGSLYFFGGANDDLWKTNAFLTALPDVGEKLLLPIPMLWEKIKPFLTLNGLIGIEILILAKVFLDAGNSIIKKKYADYLKKLATLASFAIVIWHFVDGVVYGIMKETVDGETFALSLLVYMGILLAIYAIGSILGTIVKKIFGM